MNVSYKLGKTLASIYQEETLDFVNELQPISRRIDTVASGAPQLASDSFNCASVKRYMNLRLKKTERYTVTCRDTTVEPENTTAGNSGVMTNGAILNAENFFPTNFGISKSISQISIKAGETILEETQDERNPWLIEARSAQFDMDACKKYGQHPLFDSGIGNFNNFISNGPVRPPDVDNIADEPNLLNPIRAPYLYAFSDFQRTINNTHKRWRIVGTPTFKNAATDAALIAVQGIAASTSTDWFPATSLNPTVWFWGQYIGTYVIEVEEYIISKFLTTPYGTSNIAKSIKLEPSNQVFINLNYDTNFIQNGLFKWNPNRTALGPATSSIGTSYMSVARITSASTIEIESFDVFHPPQEGSTLKMLNWKPVRIQNIANVPLTNGGTTEIVANYNNDARIPKYVLVSVLPELWTGNLNSVLQSNLMAPYNTSTIMPAQLTKLQIEIGQEIVTENLPFSEILEMSQELMNDKEVREQLGLARPIKKYQVDGIDFTNVGTPFLIVDFEKLSMRSSQFRQYLANVQYPTIQNIKMTIGCTGRNFNNGDSVGLVTNSMTYTPHIYFFYPHMLVQHLDGHVSNDPIRWSTEVVEQALLRTSYSDPNRELTLTGGGWFSDVKDYLKDNYQNLLKHVVKGVRYGEEHTRDHNNWKNVNTALSLISQGAKQFGYGRRAGAIQNLR